jgi:hypothetical protein
MFHLTDSETESLRSQFGISKDGRGGRRYNPYVFTEQGVSMLSAVLRSATAVSVSIEIIRTFIKIRSLLSENQELGQKLALLERKYDHQFKVVFDAVKKLLDPPEKSKSRIGFHP